MAVVVRSSGYEDGRAPTYVPALEPESFALKAPRPGRVAYEDGLCSLIGLARRTRHRQRNRRNHLLDAGHVLVTLGNRPFLCLRDGGQDEGVEIKECRQLLAESAHDRPLVEARRETPADRVDDLQPPALVLDRFVAASVPQGERDLVRHLFEEGGRRG